MKKNLVARGVSLCHILLALALLTTISPAADAAPKKKFFIEDFSGTSIDPDSMNKLNFLGASTAVVADGQVFLDNGDYLTTEGLHEFEGKVIVVEARLVGPSSNRTTIVSLIDSDNGQRLDVGDTSYGANGLFYTVTDTAGNGLPGANQVYFGGTTDQYRNYRISLSTNKLILERGATIDTLTERHEVVVPFSPVGRRFYLRINTGCCDGFYSPSYFDWVSVRVYKHDHE
jgi:hypothetical protein